MSADGRTPDRAAQLARRQGGPRPGRDPRCPRRLAVAALVLLVIIGGAVAGVLAAGGDDPPATGKTATKPARHSAGGGTATKTPAGSGADAAGPASTTSPSAEPEPDGSATDPREPAAWPRSGAAAKRTPVPILMYHLIAAAPAGTAYPGLWVPPAELEAHVKALAKAGFVGVTLGEAWDAWHGDGRLPAKPVVLSFDDGDITHAMGAAPILEEAGWPGVLNLTVNHLGKGGLPMWGAKRLLRQGWSIDSHTVTHPDITTLGADGLRTELSGARTKIKARLGVTARFFCYPAGRNSRAARAAVKAAGYRAATTTEPGIARASDDPYGLPRLRIDPGLSGAAVVKLAKGDATVRPGGAEV